MFKFSNSFRQMLSKITDSIGSEVFDLSNKQNLIGIDLGTANMVAYIKDLGVVVNEPSFLTYNKKTNQIFAVGKEAKKMIGRTPNHLEVIQPLIDGVVSDFEASEHLLTYIINKVEESNPKLLPPKIILGVPSGGTDVDIKSIREAALSSGVSSVYIVPEPYAAAVGIGLDIKRSNSIMVLDVGGGTSDLIVISFGEIIAKDSASIAGDKFEKSIIKYLKDNKNMITGKITTELLKIEALTYNGDPNFIVSGRDLNSGLPVEKNISREDIIRAISPELKEIVELVKRNLSNLSPEISADIRNSGIHLVGGGSLIDGFKDFLEAEISIKVSIPGEPTLKVAQGASVIAENPDMYKRHFLDEGIE